jgi:ABC-type bacteriocin/lantibiotic exporter with double-glycine peptidase domain
MTPQRCPACGATPGADRVLAARARLMRLPDVRQHTAYACGAAALQAVLAYHGIDARGDELMDELGTDPVVGTRWWEIKRVAERHKLRVEKHEGMTTGGLKALLARDVPVVLAIQAWADRTALAGDVDWADRTEDGHYVVAVGYDERLFYFEDPAIFGVGYIPHEDLAERWFDFDEHGTRLDRFGLAFFPGDRLARDNGFSPIE